MTSAATRSEHVAHAERRRSPRNRLCLDSEAEVSGVIVPVLVHELSGTGFLMETAAPLAIGELLHLRLADGIQAQARVIWRCGHHSGCEFQQPLSKVAFSAALLKARAPQKGEGSPRRIRIEQAQYREEAELKLPAAVTQRNFVLALCASLVLWSALVAAFIYALL